VSYSLIIRPDAEDDIAEARDWYQARSDDRQFEFLDEIDEMLEHICEMPELYAPEYKRVRRVGSRLFPYVV